MRACQHTSNSVVREGVKLNDLTDFKAMNRPKNKLVICEVDSITAYLPPSPLPEETESSAETMATASSSTIEFSSGQPEISADNHGYRDLPEDPVHTSDLPTPESTPTKDYERLFYKRTPDSPHTIQLLPDAEIQGNHYSCGKENDVENCTIESNIKTDSTECGSSRECDSPKPTQAKQTRSTAELKAKGKQKKGGPGRPRKANKSARPESLTPRKSKKSGAPAKKEGENHLLTEYFPVRRSARRTTTDLKKQHQDELEKAILSGCTDGLTVKQILGKGRGVVSTKDFKRGEFVVEYIGDLISHATAKEREKKYSANPEYGCYMYYFTHNNKSFCIDATAESGKLGRLLNHSCRVNNCATKVVAIDGTPYLILVASRDIKAGEELLYDYGDRSKESLEAHPWLAL